jgi:cell division protein FtsL
MAAATARYGQGAVFGSLAYDFDNPELYAGEYAAPRTPAARPRTQTQTRVRTRARTAVRTRQGIAPLSIAGFAVAALLFTVAIAAQIQLFAVSAESVELNTRLTALQEEQAKLRVGYESAFNLSEIETYAMETLGMQKPNADQVIYIDTSAPDHAVVVAPRNENFAQRAADCIAQIRAYFG